MNGKYRRAMVTALKIESGIPAPLPKARQKTIGCPESPWKEFVMKLQDGDSVIIPTRQIASLSLYVRRAGFKGVQSSRLGNLPWDLCDLDSTCRKGTVVHQSRMWFFKKKR